jgi:riboflavin kinase / FMN adenylyltransferase
VQLYETLSAVPADFGPSVVAIGKFDGMHSGHQQVLATLREEADRAGLVSVALTFDRNPLSLLRPESCPDPLISNAQKIELIERAGVDVTLMLAFDKAFSEQTPREFVELILIETLRTKMVLVGIDFRFGVRGSGTVDTLEEFGHEVGFSVRRIADVVPDPDTSAEPKRRASSTWVRELLSAGAVAQATTVLGREPTLRGVVVDGAKRGRKLGYPTANLGQDIEGFLPKDGVYAARVRIAGNEYGAAVSIGNNPTFEGVPERQVEAHILDEKLELYGKSVELAFVEYVRPMQKFRDADALVAQMAIDERNIREVLRERARHDG